MAVACVWFFAGATSAFGFDPVPPVLAAQGTVQVAFAPWDDLESMVTDAIDAAQIQVLVQAYLLTNRRIADALLSAHRRGVDVRVLADAEQLAKSELSRLPELAAAGIPVWLETKYQNAHNKIIVIDAATPDATIITGSFNFTWGAQHKNAENILVTRQNPSLASRYASNWERHKQDAVLYSK